jgi:two-component system, NarL family, invasion response regulator UvrY
MHWHDDTLIKIAVADDHHLFREAICTHIDQWENCKVIIQAANGRQLLEKLQNHNLPDLAMIDLEMPEMNGYETLKAIKEKFPAIRLLVISQHHSEELVCRIIKFGAQGFVNKGDELSRFKKAIREMMLTGYFFSDHTAAKMVKKAMQRENLVLDNDLSDDEINFLKLICTEKTYNEMATQLKMSDRHLEYMRQVLFERFDVASRTGLAVIAMKKGLAV